jgi:hypothetical protein
LIGGLCNGSSGGPAETIFGEQLMSTKQLSSIPLALSQARHQLDLWRSQQPNKRTRLPKEFWQQAVALAKEHGLNKTARALNVKYYSLKKHLDQADVQASVSLKTEPHFIEMTPGMMTPGGVECTIEWAEGHNATVRMHIKGAGLSELTALAGVLRSGRT